MASIKAFLLKSLLIFTLVSLVSSLTTVQISEKCHCDITSSFCDFGCCCDLDCGSSISTACTYSKSSYYCPKTEFFKSVKSSNLGNSNCYYYNSTSTLISQHTLTNTQKQQLLSKNSQITPVSKTLNSGYKGYKLGSILTIGGKSLFSFFSNTGNCLTTATTDTFSFKFGVNSKISCMCNSCGTPLLFSDILGKALPKYLGISSNDITLPQITDAFTTLKINLIIGKYGSQKIKYIERFTYSYSSDGSNTRTLYINFVDSDTIKQEETSATFFPQIPLDMFYPIHIWS